MKAHNSAQIAHTPGIKTFAVFGLCGGGPQQIPDHPPQRGAHVADQQSHRGHSDDAHPLMRKLSPV